MATKKRTINRKRKKIPELVNFIKREVSHGNLCTIGGLADNLALGNPHSRIASIPAFGFDRDSPFSYYKHYSINSDKLRSSFNERESTIVHSSKDIIHHVKKFSALLNIEVLCKDSSVSYKKE